MPLTRSIFARVVTTRRTVVHCIRVRRAAGAEHHLVELTRALAEEGWTSDVLVLAPQPETVGGYAERLAEHCRAVHVRRMASHVDPRLVLALRHRLRSGACDVVHAHLLHADWHVAVAAGARRPDVALVSTKHNHDPFRARQPIRTVERRLTARYDGVIAISASLARFTEEVVGRRPRVVRYGLTPGSAADGETCARSHLLAVGRLERQKGFDVLLDAMPAVLAAHPAARLTIVGEGRERARLEQRIRRLGLEGSVELAGWREDVGELLRGATLLVHPSRWEGFGLVLLEAMSAGTPVVATDVGAIPEVVQRDATGLIVPPSDPAAIAEAVTRLLSEPEVARAMGRRGRRRVTEVFAPASMAAETAAVYRDALERAQARRAIAR